MQATQPVRTFNPTLAGFAALGAAAVIAAAGIAAAIVPSFGSSATSGSSGAAAGQIEVRRTVGDLYGAGGAGSGAIEVRRTVGDLYGADAPLVLDRDAMKGAGQRGVHGNVPE
jgi:hypothetical protein